MPDEHAKENLSTSSPIDEPLVPIPGLQEGILGTMNILSNGISGIGAQFREEAHIYDERYFQVESKVEVITRALALAGAKLPPDCVALDIGCGSGNATFAILKIFRCGRVFSTDLSPEMLSILVAKAERLGSRHQITAFVTDASSVALRPQSLDIVIGSSMVHHLSDPEAFLTKILEAVRPGGVAMFFEPFQAGHVVLRNLLECLHSLGEIKPGFSASHLKFFTDYSSAIDILLRPDRPEGVMRVLDDKWLFTRDLFYRIAERFGCRINIFATNPPLCSFETKIVDLVFAGLGQVLEWPDWARDVVRKADLGISPELREELLMEGCIVYSKI